MFIYTYRRPSGDRPYSSVAATEARIALKVHLSLDVSFLQHLSLDIPSSKNFFRGFSDLKNRKHDSAKHFPIRRLAAPSTRHNLLFLPQPLLWEHHVSRNVFLKNSIGKSTQTYNVLCIHLFCRSRPTTWCLVTCIRIYAQNMCVNMLIYHPHIFNHRRVRYRLNSTMATKCLCSDLAYSKLIQARAPIGA